MDYKYIVIELQTNADGTVGNLVYSYDTEEEAQNKFYLIMAAAVVSDLPCHAVMLLRSDAVLINSGQFVHEETK